MKRRARLRGAFVAAMAIGAVATVPTGTSGAEQVAGAAGTDTSLPLTESSVTVSGRGDFADLSVTVNQTANLGNQAISVTWEGARPTSSVSGAEFAEHFLQIMQCWSEPGAVGPEPEQCVFGATDGVYGGRNGTLYGQGGFTDERVIARGDFESFDASDGVHEDATNWLWMPFRSVTGEEIGVHVDTEFSPAVESGDYWLNPLFNATTTNEIPGGRTRADGTGEELFEVHTGMESSGLGCGQAVLRRGTERVVPDCWLVIVPRGSAEDENVDTINSSVWETGPAVMTSPLRAQSWANRITIPLEFNSVDTPCNLGDDERHIVGSELPLRAVSSWQPVLCSTEGLPPYVYASVGDSSARLQLTSGTTGAPGMAVTSRPLNPNLISPDDPVTYAPLTLSSIVIGFNIERSADVTTADEATRRLQGIRIAELNLTPRLVAKLLTQSYQSQVRVANSDPGEGYEWHEDNPRHLDEDPDFLQFNPEFELLRPLNTKNFGGLVLTAGTSDVARQVWEWILADPEAKAWLDGEPDEWGMVVNPVYATTAEANVNDVAFGDPIPETFPKSDPYCYQAPAQGEGGRVVPPKLCGTDWLPYAQTYRDAAQRTRAANDGARTTRDTEAASADRVYRADGPQRVGQRTILSIVDSATASQYGLQTARLSRAGDNGDDREFIAADADGMLAAVDAMEPAEGVPDFLVPVPTAEAPRAYPLTALTYAAVMPYSLDEVARVEYAAFLAYAATVGQTSGLEIGLLPPGYTELPDALLVQTASAALELLDPPPLDDGTTTTTTVVTAATPAGGGSSSPAGSTRSGSTPSGASDPPATSVPPPNEPPVVTPTTEVEIEVARGTTPISSTSATRWALPLLVLVALLSMLGSLEITKRPRRARPTTSASIVLVVGAIASTLALPPLAVPAAAQDEPVREGDLRIVEPDGDRISEGGSATEFTLLPTGRAECPGDSQNDNYRLYSVMVPVDSTIEGVTFDGLGPSPQVYERYEDFRMPLYDINTRDFAAGLTAERETEGGPGAIVDIPILSFGVYRQGDMPLGAYRIGLVCTTYPMRIMRYWDTEILVTADDADPAGFTWRVTGAGGGSDSGGSGRTTAIAVGVGAAGLALLGAFRARRRVPDRTPQETR